MPAEGFAVPLFVDHYGAGGYVCVQQTGEWAGDLLGEPPLMEEAGTSVGGRRGGTTA